MFDNYLLATLVVGAVCFGCKDKVPKCVEGASIACACPSGGSGTQVCNNKGAFEACSCSSGEKCDDAALKCDGVPTKGLSAGDLHNRAYEANNSKQYAKAICLASKGFDAPDDVLNGMSHFEASRGWYGLDCNERAVTEIEASLAVRPQGRDGWKEACDWCAKIHGRCEPCATER